MRLVRSYCDRMVPLWFGLAFRLSLVMLAAPAWADTATLISSQSNDAHPISFANEIVPVLTKLGCNTGACHAKAGGGQNGFQLSLLGFEPEEDYRHLVWESRGRRVFPAAPDQSLLLLKPSGGQPHGGGVRMAVDSDYYRLLQQWIAQGTPRSQPSAPELISIEVRPDEGVLERESELQLIAIARYSDQSERDVTSLALYESNDPALIESTSNGLVRARDLPGKASVMVRFQGKVAVYSAAIPKGTNVDDIPPSDHFIDRLVFENLKKLGIPPSPVCDDATFLRRVTLDIAGRLPTLQETQAFLADDSGEQTNVRREHVIDELLRSPGYADAFANKWTTLLKNRRDEASDIKSNFAFHAWIRDSLLANRPYDEIVRELLAATGTVGGNPAVAWYKRVKEPKEQIEDVAQLFLGVRMQCAQCHHHPFERWSQDDYYALSAFFTQIGRKPSDVSGEDLIFHDRGIAQARNVKSGAMILPKALGDEVGEITADEDPRLRLADWMSDPQNPFFAKALVNRYWKHFMGRGLVEPEDDLRDTNPPTNPELLTALQQHFIDSGFDLKSLVRAITTSKTYQLSSTPIDDNLADRQNYSRHYPTRLQAEMILDAIDDLAGTRTDFANLPLGTRAISLPDNSYNKSSNFLLTFGRPGSTSVCECERVQSASLAQSLHFLNAPDIQAKMASPSGRAAEFSKSHFADPATPPDEQVRDLYLIAFSRPASEDELSKAVAFLNQSAVDADGKPLPDEQKYREHMEDLIWALINTKEFLFNH